MAKTITSTPEFKLHILVHALHKKTQKTPKKDLDLAKSRMKQIKQQLK